MWRCVTIVYTFFFISDALFNSASVFLNFFMNCAPNVVSVFFNTYKHHHTEKHFYLIYLCPCLDLGLLNSYPCDLFLIFIYRICPIIFEWYCGWRMGKFSNSKSSASGCYLEFAWFFANFSLVLLIKVLLTKKKVYS